MRMKFPLLSMANSFTSISYHEYLSFSPFPVSSIPFFPPFFAHPDLQRTTTICSAKSIILIYQSLSIFRYRYCIPLKDSRITSSIKDFLFICTTLHRFTTLSWFSTKNNCRPQSIVYIHFNFLREIQNIQLNLLHGSTLERELLLISQ